ncbi:hypothetical protein [Halalkalibacter okhensis]|uniref:Uncharacterized protein n=1 Tax=Halalkalibacter okhensis TaxID=333138 RepID=A0A0B0IEV5_9BACI|nr:hypothetical protein [Halalkalibacter okhensis]KHF41128.1 hypothetical protein LQ50_05000 [Halalkalibacter okhensis]
MIKAIMFGVFFVFLCVAIPSFLGFYHSSNETPEQESAYNHEHQMAEETKTKSESSSSLNEETDTFYDDESNEQANTEVSSDDLVFSNRDEAIEAVLERFSLTELISIFSSVRNGVDDKKRDEIVEKLQEQFSDEEIEALKVIGFAELEKVLQ